MDVLLTKPKLFNPAGNDDPASRSMVNGNITNIFNLNDVKYPWANKLYRQMAGNTWFPEKVDLSEDKKSIKTLDEAEYRAFKGILSFLIFLDSVQTNNVPNIFEHITAPEVKFLGAIQTFQEAIHSQSYQYILESLVPSEERRLVYDNWRTDKVLFDRIRYIGEMFQEFLDNQNLDSFKRVLIANYLLEGLYFYNGFSFFYQLASRSKMMGTTRVIRYINRDELTHCLMFRKIIPEVFSTTKDKDMIYEMFETATIQEINWSHHILGDDILGITKQSSEDYTKWLSNQRLKDIGLEPIYTGITKNPYSHLAKIANEEGSSDVRENFFEGTVTNYSQSEGTGGWDLF